MYRSQLLASRLLRRPSCGKGLQHARSPAPIAHHTCALTRNWGRRSASLTTFSTSEQMRFASSVASSMSAEERETAALPAPAAAQVDGQPGKGKGSDKNSEKETPPPPSWFSGANWRDTLKMGLLLLLGGVVYDALLTNKDAAMLWLREVFVVTLEVRSSQDEFFIILEWLAACSALGQSSRNLMITERGNAWRTGGVEGGGAAAGCGSSSSYAAQCDGQSGGEGASLAALPWDVSPGIGTHTIRHNGRRFWVSRRYDAEKGKGVNLSDTLPQVLTISCMGRGRGAMEGLLKEIHAWHRARVAEKVPIYVVDGADWVSVGTKSRRDLSSVFLPSATKDGFVRDVGTFLRSEAVYQSLGLPWRRGYLFHGPPGTGKSSLIAAVASEYRLPVYLMSFKGAEGSGGATPFGGGGPDLLWLTRLINTCQRPCVLVMEDLDTSAIALGASADDRNSNGEESDGSLSSGNSGSSGAVSGLLNALDGLPSTDGKVLIITANDPSRLPPALLRPGRIDDSIAFTAMGDAERRAMAAHFARLAEGARGLAGVSETATAMALPEETEESPKASQPLPLGSVHAGARIDAAVQRSPAEVQNALLNELLYSRGRAQS